MLPIHQVTQLNGVFLNKPRTAGVLNNHPSLSHPTYYTIAYYSSSKSTRKSLCQALVSLYLDPEDLPPSTTGTTSRNQRQEETAHGVGLYENSTIIRAG